MATTLDNLRAAQLLFAPGAEAVARQNAQRLALAQWEAQQRARQAELLREQGFRRELAEMQASREDARNRAYLDRAALMADAQANREDAKAAQRDKEANEKA